MPEYWIVDPRKNTLEVYVLKSERYTVAGRYDEQASVTSPSLPGLSFDARRLFEE